MPQLQKKTTPTASELNEHSVPSEVIAIPSHKRSTLVITEKKQSECLQEKDTDGFIKVKSKRLSNISMEKDEVVEKTFIDSKIVQEKQSPKSDLKYGPNEKKSSLVAETCDQLEKQEISLAGIKENLCENKNIHNIGDDEEKAETNGSEHTLEKLQISDTKTTNQINGLGTPIMSITAPSYASIVEKPAHLIPNTDDQIILSEVPPLPSNRKSTLIIAAESEKFNETIEDKDAEGFTTVRSKRLSKISNENEETKESSKIEAAEPFDRKEPEIVKDIQTNKKSSLHQTDSETITIDSKKKILEFGNINEEKNTVYEGECDNEIGNRFTHAKEESKKDDYVFSDKEQVSYVEKHTESMGVFLTEETKVGIKEEYSKESEVICDILNYVSINAEEKQGETDIDSNQREDTDNDTIKENENKNFVIYDVELEKADKEIDSISTEVTDVNSKTSDENEENYMAECVNEDKGKKYTEISPTEKTNNASKDKCDVKCDADKYKDIGANVTDMTNTVLDIQNEKEYNSDKEIADVEVVEASQLKFPDANKDKIYVKCDVNKDIDIEANAKDMSIKVLEVQKENESESNVEIGINQSADVEDVETSQLELLDANEDKSDIKSDVDKDIDIEANVTDVTNTVLDVQKENESEGDMEIGSSKTADVEVVEANDTNEDKSDVKGNVDKDIDIEANVTDVTITVLDVQKEKESEGDMEIGSSKTADVEVIEANQLEFPDTNEDKSDVKSDVDKDIDIETNVADVTNTVHDVQKEKESEKDMEIGCSQIADVEVAETSQLEFPDANTDKSGGKCDVDTNIDIQANVTDVSNTVLDVQKEKESESNIEIRISQPAEVEVVETSQLEFPDANEDKSDVNKDIDIEANVADVTNTVLDVQKEKGSESDMEIRSSQTADVEVVETSQLECPNANKEKRTKSENLRGVEYKMDIETGRDDTEMIMTKETEDKSDIRKDIIQVVGVDEEGFQINQVEEINAGANNEKGDENEVIYDVEGPQIVTIINEELNISDQSNEKSNEFTSELKSCTDNVNTLTNLLESMIDVLPLNSSTSAIEINDSTQSINKNDAPEQESSDTMSNHATGKCFVENFNDHDTNEISVSDNALVSEIRKFMKAKNENLVQDGHIDTNEIKEKKIINETQHTEENCGNHEVEKDITVSTIDSIPKINGTDTSHVLDSLGSVLSRKSESRMSVKKKKQRKSLKSPEHLPDLIGVEEKDPIEMKRKSREVFEFYVNSIDGDVNQNGNQKERENVKPDEPKREEAIEQLLHSMPKSIVDCSRLKEDGVTKENVKRGGDNEIEAKEQNEVQSNVGSTTASGANTLKRSWKRQNSKKKRKSQHIL